MKKPDWRSRPRKPAAEKRIVSLNLKLTPAEAAALRAAAERDGITMTAYIVRAIDRRPL